MEPWALPAWQSRTPGQGGEPGDTAPSIADTPTALQVGELKPEESSVPEGAQSPRPMGGIDPEGAEAGLPSLGQQAVISGRGCLRLEDEEVEALTKVRGLGGLGSASCASHHVLWLARRQGKTCNPAAHLFSPSVCPRVCLCDYLSSLH